MSASKIGEKTRVQTFIPLLLNELRNEIKLIASATILIIALAQAGFFKWVLQKIIKVCAWKLESGFRLLPLGADTLRRSKLLKKYNKSA
jgi:hypothetical protein